MSVAKAWQVGERTDGLRAQAQGSGCGFGLRRSPRQRDDLGFQEPTISREQRQVVNHARCGNQFVSGITLDIQARALACDLARERPHVHLRENSRHLRIVEVDLPLLLRAIKGTVESKIYEKLDEVLGRS